MIMSQVSTGSEQTVLLLSTSNYILYKKVDISLGITSFKIPEDNLFYGYLPINTNTGVLSMYIKTDDETINHFSIFAKYKVIDEEKDFILENDTGFDNSFVFATYDALSKSVLYYIKSLDFC